MKKFVFALTLMLMSVFTGFGQATIKPSLGFSFNNFSETISGEFQGKAGAQIGASVAFGKKFYVEPGVFYVGKSSEFSSTGGFSFSADDIISRLAMDKKKKDDVVHFVLLKKIGMPFVNGGIANKLIYDVIEGMK